MICFDRLPFYVGPMQADAIEELPAALPFSLSVNPDLAIPQIEISEDIEMALALAYGKGSNLSTPIGVGVLGEERLRNYVDTLSRLFEAPLEGRRFFEIGSGTGELLNELKGRGAQVMGFEIGPAATVAEERYGIEMIKEDLYTASIPEPFDCVYSYGCLEHIVDLPKFFEFARKTLRPGGLFVHDVPNTDLCYRNLRLEDLAHQHVSYFTAENGERLFAAQGFPGGAESDGGPGLYLWGRFDPSFKPFWPGRDASAVRAESKRLEDFAERLSGKLERLRLYFAEHLAGKSVGLYAGGQVVAALLDFGCQVRFFDGDPTKTGKALLRGLPPIEPLESLRQDPVDLLVIVPAHHYAAIADFLHTVVRVPASTRLANMADI